MIRRIALAMAACAASLQAQVSVDFPLGIGFHMPAYDRVNGVTLPFGPSITVGDDKLVLEPLVTYRSHLGDFDPGLTITGHPMSAIAISVSGERGTFTNDRWIHSDIVNSIYTLAAGRDARNYFRADRAEARVTLSAPLFGGTEAYIGSRFENGWSTGWRLGEERGPWSIFGRSNEVNGIDRPNPLIDQGHIASMLAGVAVQHQPETGRFQTDTRLRLESAWHTPLAKRFTQVTVYEEGAFHTFMGQRLEAAFHAAHTVSGTAPRQRYAYLGGTGTLTTEDLLSLGGDHMYFLDAQYVVPIPVAESIPFMGGHSYVAPRFAVGAANIGHFGVPTQNIGLRVAVALIRADYMINPRTHHHDVSLGLSFAR